ncbi:MAG: cytochrome b [Hydrogenophilaceae bacterium]|nr:cytochrome b [Hydrogenophilaceae bacterium]
MKPTAYTRTAITLHWLLAGLILVALPLGLTMAELALSPTKLQLYAWHKWLGVTVFGLALVRVVWRLTHPAPPLPASLPAWQRTAAHGLHGLLYGLMLAIPLSGWLMSSAKGFQTVYLGLWPIPDLLAKDEALAETLATLHAWLNYSLIALLLAHVGAALKHHFVERDAVLGRMLPWLQKN